MFLCLFICLSLLALPFQQVASIRAYNEDYNNFATLLGQGPTEEEPELPIQHLYALLNRNKYSGLWHSSIKRS